MNYKAVIDKYNNELTHYTKEVVPGFENYLKKSRKPYQKILRALYDFYMLLGYIVDEKFPDNKEQNQDNTPLMMIYSKSCLSLFGIYSCLNNGLVSEAPDILRNLFETYVNLKAILEKDTKNRIKLYHDFKYVIRWNQYQANLKLLEDGIIEHEDFEKSMPQELIKKTKKEYDEIKNRYNSQRPYHWAWLIYRDELKSRKMQNPSLKFICEKFSILDDYVKIYSTLSTTAHINSNIEYLVTIGDSITPTPSFSKNINLTSLLAITYCSKIARGIIDYLNIDDKDEVILFIKNFVVAVQERHLYSYKDFI